MVGSCGSSVPIFSACSTVLVAVDRTQYMSRVSAHYAHMCVACCLPYHRMVSTAQALKAKGPQQHTWHSPHVLSISPMNLALADARLIRLTAPGGQCCCLPARLELPFCAAALVTDNSSTSAAQQHNWAFMTIAAIKTFKTF